MLLSGVLLVILSVAGRLSDHPLIWSQEATQLGVLILAFLGGAVAYRDGQLPALGLLSGRLSPKWRVLHAALLEWMVLLISGVIAASSTSLIGQGANQLSPALQIPLAWFSFPVFGGFALMLIFAAHRLATHKWSIVGISGGVAVAIGAGIWLSYPFWAQLDAEQQLVGVVVVATVLLLLDQSLVFVLIGAATFYCFASNTPIFAIPQSLENGFDSFLLLAIPFFVLAGFLMANGGISSRIVDLVLALLQRVRGGLFHAVIVTMYIFSGISGSHTADLVAVGSAMTDEIRMRRYNTAEGTAVLAASAAMGLTIPPSIALLVIGSVTGVSVAALFAGGLIPAAVLAVALFVVVSLRADAKPAVRQAVRITWRRTAILGFRAVPPLLMPVILIAGIIGGIATPTEVSSFAVAYGFILLVGYRSLSWSDLWQTMRRATSLIGMVLLLLAGANALAWFLTASNTIQTLVQTLGDLPGGKVTFLFVSIALIVITAALFEGLPAILVLAPVLIPAAQSQDINLIQYSIILVLGQGIGFYSPPIGVGFFIASKVIQSNLIQAMRHSIPYVVALLVGLVIVALVPWLTLVLPQLLGIRST